MGEFRKLRVWRYAHALMLNVHGAATGMPGAQYLSLRSQIIRAAMSIPANVVEGSARNSDRDFARFLGYSIASTRELEYHLLAARDIGAMTPETFAPLSTQVTDVRKMLYGLLTKLEGRSPSNATRKVPAQ